MSLSIETLALAKKFAKSYTDTAISQLPNGVVYRGAVDYYSDLPNNAEEGDAYTVLYQGSSGTVADGKEYVWGKLNNTLQWIPFGTDVDPSYRPFPDAWSAYTSGTISAFCAVVNADPNAVQGMAYLGELTCSDLPFSGNADAIVEIMDGTGTSGKAIHIVITSGDTAPYRWEYTYWNNGSRISGWIGFLPETVNITYTNLVALKNNSGLTPGCFYRITDYVTKINGTYDISEMAGTDAYVHYAKSAEHPFDIIVQALDEGILSENASAIQHAGDTYFANSDLSSWQLKYTIENDPTKYSWADATNGKGVIYYMKDEFNNECSYDFKNVQYIAYALTYEDTVTAVEDSLCYTSRGQRYGSVYYVFQALATYLSSGTYESPFPDTWDKDFVVGANILGTIQFPTVDATYLSTFNADWYYTFDAIETIDNEPVHIDKSLNSSGERVTFENSIGYAPDSLATFVSAPVIPQGLPVTFFECLSQDSWCCYNKLNEYAVLNIFGNCRAISAEFGFFFNVIDRNCYDISFGTSCEGNAFCVGCADISLGHKCNYNYFGDECYFNTFGNTCETNKLQDLCGSNSFGNDCNSNSFGENCNYNSFGDNCSANTFLDSCNSNSFGNYCGGNSFDGGCSSNSFGNECTNNSSSSNCSFNSFGNGCGANSLGYSCTNNSFSNICSFNSFNDDCKYNSFSNSSTYNSFGSHCYGNSFGNDCTNNSFGASCNYNSFGNHSHWNSFGDSCVSNTVSEYVCFLEMVNNTSPKSVVGRYTILSGLYGADTEHKYQLAISTPMSSQNYPMYVGKNSNGNIKTWNPADLVN